MYTHVHVCSISFNIKNAIFSRCAIPGLPNDTYKIQNSEHQALIEEYIPGYPDSMSTCDVYNRINQSRGNDTQTIPCHKWVYDKAERADTVISEASLQLFMHYLTNNYRQSIQIIICINLDHSVSKHINTFHPIR